MNIIILYTKKGGIMNKKAQLGIIEFKFFMYGVVAGLALFAIVMLLAKYGIIPFSLNFLCRAIGKV